jgi:hypothetical protein
MHGPNLTRGTVDPTQRDTIDLCLGGTLLGGSRHIWVRLGQACTRLTHALVKFSWVAQRRFLTAPSVCRGPNCPPPPPPGGAENRSDCHSQHLDPLLRVELSGLRVFEQSDPCGVRLSQYVNVCRPNRYSVGWCRSECHSV